MRRTLLVVLSASVLLGASAASLGRSDGEQPVRGQPVAKSDDGTSAELGERGLEVKAGSRRAVGEFRLRGGRTLRLRTLATTDGYTCLVDVDDAEGVAGSTCHKGELFQDRKVIFSINSDGGPARFQSLQLVGIAAPAVATVRVTRTDGSTSDLTPTAGGAFLLESSPGELAHDVLPTRIAALGWNGRQLETIEIPGHR